MLKPRFLLLIFGAGLLSLPTLYGQITIFGEDFNSIWTTGTPPPGWTIRYTPPAGNDDWHRRDPFQSPWVANPTPYAGLMIGVTGGDQGDTLISPNIDCTNFWDVQLRCSTYFRHLGGTYNARIIGSVDGGQSWPYTIWNYYGQSVNFALQTFNLTWATGQPMVRIAWVFDGNENNIFGWCLDNVSLVGTTLFDNDIMAESIIRPFPFEKPVDFSPEAIFRNVGRLEQVNIPVWCRIVDSPGGNVYYDEDTIIPMLLPGESAQVTFSPSLLLPDTDRIYIATFWSDLPTDQYRANDTIRRTFRVGWNQRFRYDDGLPDTFAFFKKAVKGVGLKVTPQFYPASIRRANFYLQAPDTLTSNKFKIRVVDDDGIDGTPGTLLYESEILTCTTGWNRKRLMFDSLFFDSGSFYLFYIQFTDYSECPRLARDAVDNPLADSLYWLFSDSVYSLDTFAGDWLIRVTVNYEERASINDDDIRTVAIFKPDEELIPRPPGVSFVPQARIENWGLNTQINVPVVCSIVSITYPVLTPYVSNRVVPVLAPGQSATIDFDAWVPGFYDSARVIVRTNLVGDQNPLNDVETREIFIYRPYFTGGPDLENYVWIDSDTTFGPTFSWIDTVGCEVAIINNEDGTPFSLPLGWPDTFDLIKFPFYDTTYTHGWVSPDGWFMLSHSLVNPGAFPNNTVIPNDSPPNRIFYVYWDDLILGPDFGGGKVMFKTVGRKPNRKFVIIWQNVARKYSDYSDLLTFQLILQENGVVTYQYLDVENCDSKWNYGHSATVGVEDSIVGIQYLCGDAGLAGKWKGNILRSGRAISFFKSVKDIMAVKIVEPTKYSFPGPITPTVKIQNFGTRVITEPFWARFRISGVYRDSVLIDATLFPSDSLTISFAPVTLLLGSYVMKCTLDLPLDEKSANDFIQDSLYIQTWKQMADIPTGIRNRRVRAGALAYYNGQIYALKGSNTDEFWRYDIATNTWESLPPMPDTSIYFRGRKRRAKAGCALTAANDRIYAFKGGNTRWFYEFNISTNTWTERCTIPYGITTMRNVKDGASLVYIPAQGYIYALKGANSLEFWRYRPTTDRWEQLPEMPTLPSGRRAKAGAGLAPGAGVVYAVKGAATNDFYTYDIFANRWRLLSPIPAGPGNKKVKAGGCIATLGDYLYLLKGGNTQEFWAYSIAEDSFYPKSSIPLGTIKRKKVKRGGAMVAAQAESLIFVFKGGNTQEFWAYGPEFDTAPPNLNNSGIMAEDGKVGLKFSLVAAPTPFKNRLQINYQLNKRGATRLQIYDVTGRLVRTLIDQEQPIGRYSLVWDKRSKEGEIVSAGIYILKLKSGGETKTIKVVLSK